MIIYLFVLLLWVVLIFCATIDFVCCPVGSARFNTGIQCTKCEISHSVGPFVRWFVYCIFVASGCMDSVRIGFAFWLLATDNTGSSATA